MGIAVTKIISSLPESRQKKINKKAKIYLVEYKNLQEFRKAIGVTQNQLANRLSVNQVNISNLEKRSDMLLSSLKKYVEALGCTLEISIKEKKNVRMKIIDLN